MIIYYSSSDEQDPPRYKMETGAPHNLLRWREALDVAEKCADDFHCNHDGWEARWPRDITLYATEDGLPLESFEVEREARPVFCARLKAKAA